MGRPIDGNDKASLAQAAFETICLMLDDIKWKYERNKANLTVRTSAIGKDLKMDLRIVVDEKRTLAHIKSPMPFTVPEEKLDMLGKAVNIANFSMLNGCFERDYSSGFLCFKVVVPYMDCELSKGVYHYALMLTCQMVDKFNDKFAALIENRMTLQEFQEFANA